LVELGVTRLGLQRTLDNQTILYTIIGLSFGCSFSLTYVDAIEFVKTSRYKKLVRGVLAIAVIVLLNELFDFIASSGTFSNVEKYVINSILRSGFIPYFIVGPYVVLC
jgi:hypothetical protein